ncbi:thiamine pyrophosphate-dependent enzyme [Corynebacterium flavescens]
MTYRHVGTAIAESLQAHGVQRVFLVPGESFLPVLDGLYDSKVETIIARQEGGASYMAEAQGKATGEPGVAMVTRGPGAANAFVGIHTAWQDATPLVLFVGLVPRADRDRESFQEFDPKAWFGTQTKQTFVLDEPSRASQVVAEALFQAKQGRPGPVVVGLPEDLLYEEFTGDIYSPIPVAEGAVSAADIDFLTAALDNAEHPLLFIGGPRWDSDSCARLTAFAEENLIPVLHDFRASDRVPFTSPANAGWLGYGRDDTAAELLAEADLVIEIGALLGDVPTDGYQLRQHKAARNIVINIDTGLRGNSAAVSYHILATPVSVSHVLDLMTPGRRTLKREAWFSQARSAFESFSQIQPPTLWRETQPGTAHMDAVIAAVAELAPYDSIYTFGAGNHCIWAQQFLPTNVFPSQLSARNGSMGYSIPGAVAAKLAFPERTIIAIAGDGEYLMNGQELATAVQYGAPFLAIVMSNGEFGTIRDHQEKHFPGRVSGTTLHNPDFAAVARGFGAYGELVTRDEDVEEAVQRALAAVHENNIPAVINVVTDPSLSLPAAL